MLRKIANILFIVLAITSCTNNATTEKHQTVRNKIENCYQKVRSEERRVGKECRL